jgi:hypothetical protein
VSTDPTTYTIRVKGHLDDHWSTWLDAAVLLRCEDGTTSLTLVDADQAQLHGALSRMRDIGVELIDLHTTSEADGRGALGDGTDRSTVVR